jgi:hypothetical protein
MILFALPILLIALLAGFFAFRGGLPMIAATAALVAAASVAATILSQYSTLSVVQITVLAVLSFNVGTVGALAREWTSERDDTEID